MKAKTKTKRRKGKKIEEEMFAEFMQWRLVTGKSLCEGARKKVIYMLSQTQTHTHRHIAKYV